MLDFNDAGLGSYLPLPSLVLVLKRAIVSYEGFLISENEDGRHDEHLARCRKILDEISNWDFREKPALDQVGRKPKNPWCQFTVFDGGKRSDAAE